MQSKMLVKRTVWTENIDTKILPVFVLLSLRSDPNILNTITDHKGMIAIKNEWTQGGTTSAGC